jgi:hypothetical protein
MARKRSSTRALRTERSVLVIAQPSPETDDLLAVVARRPDLHLLRVATLDTAAVALRDLSVALVLVCPETPLAIVEQLMTLAARARPRIPLIALRARNAPDLPSANRTVAVLRGPVLPEVLSRTIDVALGLVA